jgi:S1-C subfamily serine protease
LQGALVEEVVEGTPAAKAGIESGDVITEWNGHSVADATELVLLIGRSRVGAPIRVVLLRDGKQVELEVTIEPEPEQAER